MKKQNLLKDIYRIEYVGENTNATKRVEAWSESDAIATLTQQTKVYSIIKIERVA